MPIQYSRNYVRNLQLFELWDTLADDVFDDAGFGREAAKALQKELCGDLVLPTCPGYQQDRMLSNPVFNEYPKAIVHCRNEADVALALAFAQTLEGGAFQIRAGGHCTAGFSTGPGLLIDVKNLNHCHIFPERAVAHVGPGLKFGDFNAALDFHGLHVPGGECEDVCVGGYVQGGGYGFTSVSFGMSCDNVRSLRVMLWDGQIVTASADVNADLFWALCGGTGGNFGIVLDVEYALRPLGDCLGFAVTWPLTGTDEIGRAAELMMFLQQDYMRDSRYEPDLNLQVSFCYQTKVGADGQPETGGPTLPYLMVRGLWTGDPGKGQDAIQPIQDFTGGIKQWTKTASYNTLNKELLSLPQGMPFLPGMQEGDPMPFEDKTSRYIAKNLEILDWIEILNYFVSSPTNRAYGYIEFYGGKINEAPSGMNAFVHRDALYNLTMDVYWLTMKERQHLEDWLFGWKQLLNPHWNLRIYQNYPNITAPVYDVNYWGENRYRLSAVKGKYDPNDVFRFRQQVPFPTAETQEHIDAEFQALLSSPIVYGA